MKKTISPASRAPTTAQPIPIPAAAPAGTFELVKLFDESLELVELFDETLELVAEPANAVGVLVGPVPVFVGVVDEVAEGVELGPQVSDLVEQPASFWRGRCSAML